MNPLILQAAQFATRAHAGQVRKYTGEPYVCHCFEVAEIVAPYASDVMIAAAPDWNTMKPASLVAALDG